MSEHPSYRKPSFLTAQSQRHLIGILALGFVSGLPFLLTLSTLSFWLAECGVGVTTIGLMMFASTPYSLKFLWAPVLDSYRPPLFHRWFGRRRGWALISQIGLIGFLALMSQSNPQDTLWLTALAAFGVACFATTQDSIIDAYRIEILMRHHLGLGAAFETIGFRLGMLASGAGALYLANAFGWKAAYLIMASSILIGTGALFFMPEQDSNPHADAHPSPKKMFTEAWTDLLTSERLLWLLGFICFFKMADVVLNSMSAPFLVELGFSKIEFANVSKLFGITWMIIGGLAGGVLMHQFGLTAALIACMALQIVSCLMFVVQAFVGHDIPVLIVTMGVESFCSGLSSAAFIAYLSCFCRPPHTASHFSAFYSFGSLCRVIISAAAGWLAYLIGWKLLFFFSGVAVLPALACFWALERGLLSAAKPLPQAVNQ